jgi:hypothetical protein
MGVPPDRHDAMISVRRLSTAFDYVNARVPALWIAVISTGSNLTLMYVIANLRTYYATRRL